MNHCAQATRNQAINQSLAEVCDRTTAAKDEEIKSLESSNAALRKHKELLVNQNAELESQLSTLQHSEEMMAKTCENYLSRFRRQNAEIDELRVQLKAVRAQLEYYFTHKGGDRPDDFIELEMWVISGNYPLVEEWLVAIDKGLRRAADEAEKVRGK